jgi:cytochrome c
MRRATRGWMLAAFAGCGAALAGCDGRHYDEAHALTGGDPARGRLLARQYGCGSCHTIAGVPGANAKVGPPLAGLIERAYVAGVVPNTPANLMMWIRNPQEVDPRTAMPDLGVGEREARDIAGYLYSLR